MLVVKKFGGSSVANSERILNVARRCIEEYVKGNDVVVVLSAMGDTTDDLLDLAVHSRRVLRVVRDPVRDLFERVQGLRSSGN